MDIELLFYGISCSLIAVLIYNFFQVIATHWLLKKLNGKYLEYHENNKLHPDSKLIVDTSIQWRYAIFGSGNHLIIKRISQSRGNWDSKIPISSTNPLIATGTYSYTSIYKSTWGIHNITINLKDEIIFLEAIAKTVMNPKVSRYWIKKTPP